MTDIELASSRLQMSRNGRRVAPNLHNAQSDSIALQVSLYYELHSHSVCAKWAEQIQSFFVFLTAFQVTFISAINFNFNISYSIFVLCLQEAIKLFQLAFKFFRLKQIR